MGAATDADMASFFFLADDDADDEDDEDDALNWLVDHVEAKSRLVLLLLFVLFDLALDDDDDDDDDEKKRAVRGEENDFDSDMWLDFDLAGFFGKYLKKLLLLHNNKDSRTLDLATKRFIESCQKTNFTKTLKY